MSKPRISWMRLKRCALPRRRPSRLLKAPRNRPPVDICDDPRRVSQTLGTVDGAADPLDPTTLLASITGSGLIALVAGSASAGIATGSRSELLRAGGGGESAV